MSRTVTVRIPVKINSHGEWCSDCANAYTDERNEKFTVEAFRGYGHDEACTSVVWITAELPIPEPVEVEGRVEA